MHTIEYNLGYMEAALKELDEFLLANDVYWSIGASSPPGEPEYQQLSLGGLLMARARLQARPLVSSQQVRLAAAEASLERTRTHWRVAWEKKAAREFHARLKLWRDFMEEVRTHPDEHRDRYRYESSRRVMLELLQRETGGIPQAEVDLLHALDKLLRGILLDGPFAWEPELEGAFPQTSYWYLYGRLKGSRH